VSKLFDRFQRWSVSKSFSVGERNAADVVFRTIDRFNQVRVSGLAAEMSYYALISTIPFIVALGSSLGLLERFVGDAQILAIEDTVVGALRTVFSAALTEDVIEPLVRSLLAEERAGTAILGLLLTFFFASAVFRAVIQALDDSYAVEERRSGVYLWGLAYVLAMGSIVVLVVVLSLLVIGPLLGGGHVIADRVGLGELFAWIWSIGRWPVVFLVTVSYLAFLYRAAPNVRNRWRDSLPGAVLATILSILIAVGLRLYLDFAGPRAPEVGAAEEAIQIVSQTIGAVMAVILWMWLTSTAILTGGVFNAILGEKNRRKTVARGADVPLRS
jgi:membrane protein